MRTYGGSSYKTIDFSLGNTKIGSLTATTNKLANYTWTPNSTATGVGSLRFSSTTNTDVNGPALSSITIKTTAGGTSTTYVYSRYITSCGPTTDIVEVEQHKQIGHKIISEGQLLIEHNGVYYNTLGQVVKH